MENGKIIRLAILQRVCTEYRTALFARLSLNCEIHTQIFIGENIPNSKIKNAKCLDGINIKQLKTCFVKLRNRVLPWQKGLIGALRSFNPDVILCEGESHFIGYIQAIMYKYICNNRVAIMHWCFISLPGWEIIGGKGYRAQIKAFFRKFFDAFVVYSSFSRNCLIKLGQNSEKIFIATNVCNTERFLNAANLLTMSKDEARKNVKLQEKFTVLYVGTIDKNKRPDVMIDLAEKCDSKLFNFVLIGTGDLFELLKRRVTNLQLTNVYLLGRITKELPIYYRAADVLLIPGRGGIVISEAMSFGLPVIVFQADGTEYDLVKNEKTGILLSNGMLDDFQNAIEFLLKNPDLCIKMGHQSKRLIETEFNTNTMVNQIIRATRYAYNTKNNCNIQNE